MPNKFMNVFRTGNVNFLVFSTLVVNLGMAAPMAMADTVYKKSGWDLSYQSTLRNHPICGGEWMAWWPSSFSKRAVVDTLASYSGEETEASLLIETPDAHAGDPEAIWLFKTKTIAQSCKFSVRVASPCQELDPVRTEALIRRVMDYEPMRFTPAPDRSNGFLMNYFGFLSVYVDGRTMQRPIASIELFESLDKQTTHKVGVARLSKGLKELMQSTSAQGDQAAVEDALRRGANTQED
jgi:hypothetical protein